MGIYGWMFQSEERISAKVQSWSVEGPGDQTNAMGVGVAVDRGPCRLLRSPAFGKEQCGTVAKLLRAMATQMCEESQNPSLESSYSPGALHTSPFLHSQVGLIRNSLCCVPAQPKDSFKGSIICLLGIPSWLSCSFSNTELYPYPCFFFFFYIYLAAPCLSCGMWDPVP